MKIGHKLLLGFLTVAILVAVVGYVGVSNIKQTGESFEYSAKMEIPSLVATLEIESAARQASIKAIEYSMRKEKSDKKKTFEALGKLEISYNTLEKVEEEQAVIKGKSPDEADRIKAISDGIDNLRNKTKEYIALTDQGSSVEELFAKEEELHKVRKELIHLLYKQKENEHEELHNSLVITGSNIARGINTISTIGLASVFLALLIGLFITRSISKPIRKLTIAADEIGKGNLDSKVSVSSKGEIGYLAESFNKMVEDLRIIKENFEALIDERTAELKIANQQLQEEVNKHRQAKESLLESANQTQIAYDQSIIYAKQLNEEIIKRKRSAEDLQVSETHMKLILDTIPSAIFQVDRDLKVAWANKMANEMNPQAIGQFCYNAYTYNDHPCIGCSVKAAIDTGETVITTMHHTKIHGIQGESFWEKIGVPIKNIQGEITGAIEIARNVTNRIKAQKALQESEKQYRGTLNSLLDWITVVDADLKIQTFNSAFMKINKELGLETDIIGKTPMEIFPFLPDTLIDEYRQVFENKKMLITEETTLVNGREFITESRKIPLFEGNEITRIVTVIRDMTEQKKLERQLLQAQKMEAIGRLAGGIAHDFNNLLTTIIGYCEIILITLPKDHPLKEKIEFIRSAGEGAAALTHQLLAFSRKQVLRLKSVNLNNLVENLGKMIARIIGEDVNLEFHTKLPIGYIMADSGQIEQVLMNLAVNARDAMPKGGTLIIETNEVVLDDKFAREHKGIKPGSYIMLTVTDTGEGMTREVQENIFEPFFTTKGIGKGTGLGLATVFGIVKQHDAYISVYSEQNIGTTFKIYFPLATKTEQEVEDKKQITAPRGSERILVVDDAPSICRVVTDTLQPLGYQILEAYTAKDAIEIARSKEEKIDLLLTDVIMPEMNGKELADKLKKSRPDMKVIFMSGYTDNVILKEGIMKHGLILINKPLIPSVLANKLRKVLDE